MSIEDHKLKVFCTVAEVRSFSKASEIIHLTQPAVSVQVQALEEFYETRLLNRSNSDVTLTPAGKILYKYAKDILSLYSEAEKDISKLTGCVKGSLLIGAGHSIGAYFLPGIINNFVKMCPKTNVDLRVENTKRIVDLLQSSSIDIGFVDDSVKSPKIIANKVFRDELCLISSNSKKWGEKRDFSVYQLQNVPFIIREDGSGTRNTIEKFLLKHGVTLKDLNIKLILGSTEAIKKAVKDGIGMSIITRMALEKEIESGEINIIPIKEGNIIRNFSAIFLKKAVPSHAAEEFLSFAMRSKNNSTSI